MLLYVSVIALVHARVPCRAADVTARHTSTVSWIQKPCPRCFSPGQATQLCQTRFGR